MYDDKRIDDVVTILQAMSTDARKDILAEFTTPADVDILADVLRRIGEASTQYRGNSRVITTSQQLLDELLNLRR